MLFWCGARNGCKDRPMAMRIVKDAEIKTPASPGLPGRRKFLIKVKKMEIGFTLALFSIGYGVGT